MNGCCRGLPAQICWNRPYGCSDEPQGETNMINAKAAIATAESDAELRHEYFKKGFSHRENARTREFPFGDPNSLIAKWFFEGWDYANNFNFPTVVEPVKKTFYMVKEKGTENFAKGTGSGYNTSTMRGNLNTPPKLYSIGSAKSVVTQKMNEQKFNNKHWKTPINEYEIYPVEVIIRGNPLTKEELSAK